MSYVHLHLHSEFSLLDGACRLADLVENTRALGQTAVAVTDHGNLCGAVDFYRLAKAGGIKPLIGCEVYVAPRKMTDKQHGADTSPFHLVLLCKNETGYQNLIYMVSRGWTEGFYNKPRVDKELLAAHSEGLIALSGCLAGELSSLLMSSDYAGAKQAALWYQSIFGEDYYIELQDHGLPEQQSVLPGLKRLAKETGIGLVATNDAHYLKKSDAATQKVLVCIQTNTTVDAPSSMEFPTEDFYQKSEEEMRALFPDCPEAIDNTAKIAEQCNFEFEFGKTKLPDFMLPEGQDHFDYLRRLSAEGFEKLYPNPTAEAKQRLEYELSTIQKMGYTDYFLIVQDFIAYAKRKGIAVGPGRGSGASSLVAYCLGITGIDPLQYDLVFERFLNPERVSMPDFDIDFCYIRRQEVIDYVIEKYGSEQVAQIVTFGTMAARAAVRDVGRALGIAYYIVDGIAKLIPRDLHITLLKALEASADLKQRYESDPQVKRLIDTARALEGMPRHSSTHAAGVVITRLPVWKYVPLMKNDNAAVTQYTMTTLEELGLLKIDFLGLRNLTVIQDAVRHIKMQKPDFEIENIPEDDKKVFAMLSKGETDGVFQLESGGVRNVLIRLRPTSIEDLTAVTSLYRPGPMESIPRYIECRHHPEKVKYRHPLLEPALRATYGVIVYQEQVTRICRDLAGYSYGQADLVRRAMSKKKHDVMDAERKKFLYGVLAPDGSILCPGAIRNGVDEKTAAEIFDEMESFASYAFNKSHAAAYALIAYRTAYLRCHYPKEFMAATISSVMDGGRAAEYIGVCRSMGIAVLPPSVNVSQLNFAPLENGIGFGLMAIKNLGMGVLTEIIREREANGLYQNFVDFCYRARSRELSRRAMESLIKSGALDGLGSTRRAMLNALDEVISRVDARQRKAMEGQLGLFGEQATANETIPEIEEYPISELSAMEREITGLYLTAHPLDSFEGMIKALKLPPIAELTDPERRSPAMNDGSLVRLLGVITGKTQKYTKAGDSMAFVQLEDRSGSIEAVVFPKLYALKINNLQEGAVVVMKGRLDIGTARDEEGDSTAERENVKLICEDIQPPVLTEEQSRQPSAEPKQTAEKAKAKSKRPGLYIRVPSRESELFTKAKRVIEVFDGQTPLYVFFENEQKLNLAPRDLWVHYNEILAKELQQILGEANVAMVQ